MNSTSDNDYERARRMAVASPATVDDDPFTKKGRGNPAPSGVWT
jgi:hypothetical protein